MTCTSATFKMGLYEPAKVWFHEPVVLSKEKGRILGITAVVLGFFALGTLGYIYGVGSPVYIKNYAFTLWGMATTVALGAAIIYLVKTILSHRSLVKEKQADIRFEAGKTERYNQFFEKFFPGLKIEDLSEYHNLIGGTGYFDQDKALKEHFATRTDNIIRGQQAGKPFLGVHLAIKDDEGSKYDAYLLIGPNRHGDWWVHSSSNISRSAYAKPTDTSLEASVFTDWFLDILNGREKYLLERDYSIRDNKKSSLIIGDTLRVSLWKE